jgi:hypothetical protein
VPSDPASALRQRVGQQLGRPAPAAARELAEAARARHAGVAGVLFYGSCLRRGTDEGVHDFYVLVDDYRRAYPRAWLAAANALLPPNVFYLETKSGSSTTLRAKYAVISCADFERAVSPGCLHPYIWARFAQPALLVFARDAEARERIGRAAAEAVVTLVQRLSPFLPAAGRVQRFSLASLWQEAFRRTYTAEFRSESPETVRGIYQTDADHYDASAVEALRILAARGWLEHVEFRGHSVEVEMSPRRRRLARLRWTVLRPLARLLAVARLLKTTATFGDWLPYALWKLERHSGVHIEPSERQRRHPLLFGWPVILRLLLRRTLR